MVQRIKVGKRVLVAPLAGVLLLGAFALSGATGVRADTHPQTACVSVDQFGNVTVLQDSCSQTMHMTSVAPQVMPGQADPCSSTGESGTVTLNTDHAVSHVTVDASGDAWLTETSGGTATYASDVSTLSGSGSWTSWGGIKLNNKSYVTGDTSTTRLSMSDGTHVTVHFTNHFNVTANGVAQAPVAVVAVTCE